MNILFRAGDVKPNEKYMFIHYVGQGGRVKISKKGCLDKPTPPLNKSAILKSNSVT